MSLTRDISCGRNIVPNTTPLNGNRIDISENKWKHEGEGGGATKSKESDKKKMKELHMCCYQMEQAAHARSFFFFFFSFWQIADKTPFLSPIFLFSLAKQDDDDCLCKSFLLFPPLLPSNILFIYCEFGTQL